MTVENVVAKQSTRAQLFPELDDRIRRQTRASVMYHAAHPEEIDGRLATLSREWGVERWLQLNSAALSLVGLGLAVTSKRRRWLALPAVVQIFLFQHGVQGFCPPLVLLRKLGVRTMSEIEAEREALKALRGDFDQVARDPADSNQTLSKTSHDIDPKLSAKGAELASTLDRVPSNTSRTANERIRRDTERRLALYATHPAQRAQRLAELDREWDIERTLQVEAPLATLVGIVLGWRANERWLALPFFSQSMMLLHSLHGFYPLLPMLRRMGFRTEQEISAERYAIKVQRGDFERVRGAAPANRADEAFAAAQPGTT
jgi:hypothetical protein